MGRHTDTILPQVCYHNMITHHLLQQIPYVEVERPLTQLPEREYNDDYIRRPVPQEIVVPEFY